MKRFLLILAIATLSIPAWAASNTITVSNSACISTSCLSVSLPQDKGGAALTISGTWTGTISFEATGDGGVTWVAINAMPVASTTGASSATANGLWQVNVAGLTGIRMRASATITGAALVTINPVYVSFAR